MNIFDAKPCNCGCGTKPILEMKDGMYTVKCPNCFTSVCTSSLKSSVSLWNDFHSGEFNNRSKENYVEKEI